MSKASNIRKRRRKAAKKFLIWRDKHPINYFKRGFDRMLKAFARIAREWNRVWERVARLIIERLNSPVTVFARTTT